MMNENVEAKWANQFPFEFEEDDGFFFFKFGAFDGVAPQLIYILFINCYRMASFICPTPLFPSTVC
jgi:hypothetical protein